MAKKPQAISWMESSSKMRVVLDTEIGGWGFNGGDYITEVEYYKPSAIDFIVYSPGGSLFDALAVYDYNNRNADIKTFGEVFGYANSAATVILAGLDRVVASPNSYFLFHNPFYPDGNASEGELQLLAELRLKVAGIYAKKTGRPVDEMLTLMDNGDQGVWLSAQAALELGFVDEVLTEQAAIAAHHSLIINNMSEAKQGILEQIKALLSPSPQNEDTPPVVVEDAPVGAPPADDLSQAITQLTQRLDALETAVQNSKAEEIKALNDSLLAMAKEVAALKSAPSGKVQAQATPTPEGNAKETVVVAKNAADAVSKWLN